jgi:hypothetical protein
LEQQAKGARKDGQEKGVEVEQTMRRQESTGAKVSLSRLQLLRFQNKTKQQHLLYRYVTLEH